MHYEKAGVTMGQIREKQLECALLEYVELYGLTEKTRHLFVPAPEGSAAKQESTTRLREKSATFHS